MIIHKFPSGQPAWQMPFCLLASLITIVSSCFLSGCGNAKQAQQPNPVQAMKSPSATAFPSRIKHDWGIVLAGTSQTHTLSAQNHSDQTWSVQAIHTSCSCTLAEVPKDQVAGGEHLELTVSYKAPDKTAEHSTNAIIVLNSDKGNKHTLLVDLRASVREAITVVPNAPQIDVSPNGSQTTVLLIQNWSDYEWSDIQLKASLDWITHKFQAIPAPTNSNGKKTPTQSWRVELFAAPLNSRQINGNAKKVQITLSSEQIRSSAGTNLPEITHEIPIKLVGGERVRATPSVLYLETKATDITSESRLALTFLEKPTELLPNETIIDYELGNIELDFQWQKESEHVWELRIRTVKTANPTSAKGKLTFKFPNENLPPLEIPVYYRLKNPTPSSDPED